MSNFAPTCCLPFYAFSCIPRPAGSTADGCGCSSSMFRSSSPRRSLSRFFMFALSANCTLARGRNRSYSCPACSPWELAFRSTTPAPCWKRFSTTNPVLLARPNTGSNINRSPGEHGMFGWRNRCCRWRSWLSRFISLTLSASQLGMASFSPCLFLLMFQGGFLYVCLSSFASRWPKIDFGSPRAGAAISA